MKEIKAVVHRRRVGDVVHALLRAGFRDLTVSDVKGNLPALGEEEKEYSLELGEAAITEAKIELVCENERLPEAIAIIRKEARTGKPGAGRIYVSVVTEAISIDGD
jgi:nitrogen regulatory protein P-II 1